MKSLVAYDSAYGNTAKIAETISVSLEDYGQSVCKQVGDIAENDLVSLDLLIVGSPTQGGKPTKPTAQFIDALSAELLSHSKVAVFDTRFEASKQKTGLRMLMRTIGYAATKMASKIEKRGGAIISEPTGFFVTEKEGPLKEGELERASAWAVKLAVPDN